MSDAESAAAYAAERLLAGFRLVGSELRAAGLVSSHSGNLSVWTPDGVLITREGAMLGHLAADDLCLIGRTTQPPAADPALDTPIHRAVYIMSDARAIAHAQPPHAVVLSLAEAALVPIDTDGSNVLRRVPVLAHARDIVKQVGDALAEYPVVLVRGHGCYARGSDLLDALRHITALEQSARLIYLQRALSRDGQPRTSQDR